MEIKNKTLSRMIRTKLPKRIPFRFVDGIPIMFEEDWDYAREISEHYSIVI